MDKKISVLILVFILSIISFAGCNEDSEFESNTNFDTTQPEGCPSAEIVEEWDANFTKIRDELVDYMINTEYVELEEYPLNPNGEITEEGRQKRLEYEEFRNQYMDIAFNLCKNSSGVTLHGGSVIWLKGYDLIKKEIHPETFLGLPIFDKRRNLYEEPEYWTNETTKFVEYKYVDEIDGYTVSAYIRGWHTGSVEDLWYDLANEQNFEKASYKSPQTPGSTVYFTDDYEDENGWRFKGIYFICFGFKVFAGYYNWGDTLGTEYEYFKDIKITDEDAKAMYEYLVYRPGYNDMY